MLNSIRIEYVGEDDTLAEISYRELTSSSLRKTNAILLGLLAVFAYTFNILLAAIIFFNESLRRVNTFFLLGHFACINLIDLTFSVFFSMIFVANDSWIFGMAWCRIHAAIQEFCLLYTLISLMLMSAERAIETKKLTSLSSSDFNLNYDKFFSRRHLISLSFIFAIIAFLVAIPITSNAVPVKPFKNRFVCGVDSDCPIGYATVRIIIYISTLFANIVAFITILKFKIMPNTSLPSQPQNYNAFITRIRYYQEQRSLARLIIFIWILFLLTESPYCVLNLVYEVANSYELMNSGYSFEIPQDADTLITWLKFLFPLISPIMIILSSSEIKSRIREMCCCSSETITFGQAYGSAVNPQVMTLVATSNGLQFREDQLIHPQPAMYANPGSVYPVDLPPKYENIAPIGFHQAPQASTPQVESSQSSRESIASVSTSNVPRARKTNRKRVKRTQ